MFKAVRICALLAVVGGCILAFTLTAQPGAAPAPSYVGAKKCKKCHIKQYKTWDSTKHAKAFSMLSEKYQKNDECLLCHTTGFGKGGFTAVGKTDDLLNVQCEQCHGAGSDHLDFMTQLKKDKVDKEKYPAEKKIDRKPSDCTQCHNPHKKHAKVD